MLLHSRNDNVTKGSYLEVEFLHYMFVYLSVLCNTVRF